MIEYEDGPEEELETWNSMRFISFAIIIVAILFLLLGGYLIISNIN